MPSSTTRPAPGRDAGVSLVEMMVALVIFALMATAVIALVVRTSKVTGEDARRVVATNLANREIEIARDVFFSPTRGPDRLSENDAVNPSPLPGGTTGQPLVVDGVSYTVTRTGQWDSIGSNYATVCDNTTGDLGILRLQVRVKWAGLGKRPGVVIDTILTPPKATYASTDGHIGVKVVDRNGVPRQGVQVQATGPETRSGQTAEDGCVLLAHLTAGSYTVKLSSAGSVNPAGDPVAATSATVQQGQLWRGTIEYDAAATFTVAFTTEPGFALPPTSHTIPVTLGASFFTPTGAKAYAGTGNTRTLSNLYPTAAGYEIWAGACAANDPNDPNPATIATTPGTTTAVDVRLAPLTVRAPAGQTITATQARDSVCGSGQVVNLGPATGGQIKTSLPYGAWTLTRTGGSGNATVTLTSTGSAPTATVP